MWVPREDKDPVSPHAPGRKSASLFGAVNLSTGRLVTMMSPVFNADTFGLFLKKLIRHRRKGRKMVIITDNARYHHAVMLKDWIDAHREHLELDFLPPYSPELNPIERVWKLTRRMATHNRYFPTLEDIVNAVSHQVDLWAKPNPVLKRLCCII